MTQEDGLCDECRAGDCGAATNASMREGLDQMRAAARTLIDLRDDTGQMLYPELLDLSQLFREDPPSS